METDEEIEFAFCFLQPSQTLISLVDCLAYFVIISKGNVEPKSNHFVSLSFLCSNPLGKKRSIAGFLFFFFSFTKSLCLPYFRFLDNSEETIWALKIV